MNDSTPFEGEFFFTLPPPPSEFINWVSSGLSDDELRDLWFDAIGSLTVSQTLSHTTAIIISRFGLGVPFQEALSALVRKTHSPHEKARFHLALMGFLTYFPHSIGEPNSPRR